VHQNFVNDVQNPLDEFWARHAIRPVTDEARRSYAKARRLFRQRKYKQALGAMGDFVKFAENLDGDNLCELQLFCKNCMCCAPGRDRTFFGKQFESTCNYRIENPNAIALEYTKNLLEFKKKATLAYL